MLFYSVVVIQPPENHVSFLPLVIRSNMAALLSATVRTVYVQMKYCHKSTELKTYSNNAIVVI